MSKIEIKEVQSKRDMNKFIDFPLKLYKNNENYIPALSSSDKDMFDRKKNASYEYCDSIEILAYKGKEVGGRLAGIINYTYNKKVNTNYLRFSHFDVIDDFEVTKSMFEYIGKWGKEKGMTDFNGPLGFVDTDRQGMLIEGFDRIGMSITNYNFPYYVEHMEKLGLNKDVDFVEYLVNVPQSIDERVTKVSNALLKRFGFKLLKFKNLKECLPYIYKAFDVYNEAFYALHGTVFLTNKQIDALIKQFAPAIDFDFLPIIVDKEDNVVGFAVLAPSIAKASKKANGKMLPFGWYHLLKALRKNDTLEMYMVAVKPEYQGFGLNSILMHDVTKCAIDKGIKYAETGPELESNYKVISQWDNYNAELVRKRRCFVGKI